MSATISAVDPIIPARVVSPTVTEREPLAAGIAIGLLAASIGALYTVFARYGIEHGMAASDLTFLRFAVAGLITLPVLIWHLARDAAPILARAKLWLAVALLAGPLFGLMMFSAFQFAPASHAAVFPFAAMSVMGTLLAARFLGDRVTPRKALGIGLVLLGLITLSGLDAATFTPTALLGDLLFIIAGTMWAGFGILLRRHRLDPLLATAIVSFSALITYVPIYLWQNGAARLFAVNPSLLWTEIVVQGVVAGAGTLYTYATVVRLLGPARAAVFPALAPGLAALLAWPVLGHIPGFFELAGITLAMVGLIVSVTGTLRKN